MNPTMLILCALAQVNATPKVLVIGIDGFRSEVLETARTPSLDWLRDNGCYTPSASACEITVSGPAWSSFLCGVWMDKHGVNDNEFRGARYDLYPHFFTRVKEARPDLFTAHIVDWLPLDRFTLSPGTADIQFAHDYEDDGDARVVEAAVEVLGDHDPDVTFVYFADLDVAGHAHGFHPRVPEYIAELEEIDEQVGRILDAMQSRPRYPQEDWLVIVSSDHGGTIDGSHGRDIPEHRIIPFFVSGPSAVRGTLYDSANQVDIPATALAHLGIEIDPGWALDGRPVGLRRVTALGENLVFNGDAEWSTAYDSAEANAGVAGWTDLGTMTVIRYDAPEGYPAATSPGPRDRGRNFFCGGEATESNMHQVIDVADLAADIDAGRIRFELSGWFGGYAEQRDIAWLRAELLDERGGTLAKVVIGDVTANERRQAFGGEGTALTGLLRKSASGAVPPGTRRVRVTLHTETEAGLNDGYADNLSLVLH